MTGELVENCDEEFFLQIYVSDVHVEDVESEAETGGEVPIDGLDVHQYHHLELEKIDFIHISKYIFIFHLKN